jgi:hypothetical protein
MIGLSPIPDSEKGALLCATKPCSIGDPVLYIDLYPTYKQAHGKVAAEISLDEFWAEVDPQERQTYAHIYLRPGNRFFRCSVEGDGWKGATSKRQRPCPI